MLQKKQPNINMGNADHIKKKAVPMTAFLYQLRL